MKPIDKAVILDKTLRDLRNNAYLNNRTQDEVLRVVIYEERGWRDGGVALYVTGSTLDALLKLIKKSNKFDVRTLLLEHLEKDTP